VREIYSSTGQVSRIPGPRRHDILGALADASTTVDESAGPLAILVAQLLSQWNMSGDEY
jgi:hypothetical protein